MKKIPNCLDCDKLLKDYRSERCRSCAGKLKKVFHFCKCGKQLSSSRPTNCKSCANSIKTKNLYAQGKKFGFQKGHPVYTTRGDFVKGQSKFENAYVFPNGESHPNWKGDAVGYGGVHMWKRKNSGNSPFCENCGEEGRFSIRVRKGIMEKVWSIHWHNLSGEYKRDLNDWIGLCARCHSRAEAGSLSELQMTR